MSENMAYAETALLLAVRDSLRTANGWTPTQCEIEFDEMVPATNANFYIVVMTGGYRFGPDHNTCGGISDLIFGVEVAAIQRIGNVPRDRRRDVFIKTLGSLNALIDLIYPVINWNQTTLNLASTYITDQTGSTEGFCELLRSSSISKKPQIVYGEIFGAKNDEAAGLMRKITFDGARRLTSIT